MLPTGEYICEEFLPLYYTVLVNLIRLSYPNIKTVHSKQMFERRLYIVYLYIRTEKNISIVNE